MIPPKTRGSRAGGEVLQEYPEDKPYPSRLVLGWCQNRPLHVVYADNSNAGESIIITVYEPDSGIWEPDFRSKRT